MILSGISSGLERSDKAEDEKMTFLPGRAGRPSHLNGNN
jgi:hypothetical protein